jgi:hypothetical protein
MIGAGLSISAVSAGSVVAQTQLGEGVQQSRPTGASEDLFGDGGVFTTVADILLFLVGAISVIMLIIGGIRYVVSAGDQQAVTNAKNTILYAIVGIVIAFLAFAAVNFVVGQLESN